MHWDCTHCASNGSHNPCGLSGLWALVASTPYWMHAAWVQPIKVANGIKQARYWIHANFSTSIPVGV
eukprot:CAMPEP_0183347008 /NCGR_PEP_ID=MMETSP0164_2-20130417/11962_1 /TAXON_ID=221442 /ORGANISM="Coccolithus pelagicus ssp braarudi, Strain PLY182g" /LENGTH=66 /DNA_ID=CAMNT_0025518375 /DNA_START=587 /DNA_END=787 /DNA_ORIENTATION=-